MRLFLTASALTLLAGASVPMVALAQPAWFDQASASASIGQIQQASVAPGLSAAIMKIDDESVGTAVAGARRASAPGLVTDADRFHIGSNTKAFTAQLAAKAVDAGLISWDTTLEEAFGPASTDPSYAGVTLRQLLTHQGGTPQFGSLEEWGPLYDLAGTPVQQRETFARDILSKPRAVPPGAPTFERYSNAGFAIAASMVERATGQSWESMIDATFNQSMGLDVHPGTPGFHDGSEQPFGHVTLDGQLVEIGPGIGLPDAMSPAGNLSMSVSDLARFGRQHLRAVSGLDNTLGLSAESLAVIHDYNFGEGFFGMGWFPISIPGVDLYGFGHDGSTTAFDSLLLVDTVHGFSIAVASNGTLTGADIGSTLFEAALAMRASVIPAPGAALSLAAGLAMLAPRRRR